MQLTQADSLRLNVLLKQPLQAIRIDEGKMIVYGLTEKGEPKIQLNPDCKDEVYVKRVKELISTQILGSPGGYPVFLKRWTRMGQTRSESLERLLQLGEPEAVVAVVGAPGITDELARRAWWALPSADSARRMLEQKAVAEGEMGKVLSEFLLEFLPFEEEPKNLIKSVELVLQPNLITEEEKLSLWKKGQRKNGYLVGFLTAIPDELPIQNKAHPKLEQWQSVLSTLAGEDNIIAEALIRILSADGQNFLHTFDTVMKKPSNQDVVVALFEAVEQYLSSVRPHTDTRRDIDEIKNEINSYIDKTQACCHADAISQVLDQLPDALEHVEALLSLSCLGEQLLAPIFAKTDAVGSVMRKKIEPVTTPVLQCVNTLRGI